jgi:altronate dehydratase
MNASDLTPSSDPRLLRLAPDDNVCVVTATMEAAERVQIDGRWVRVAVRIPAGHKIAVASIAAGEAVRKHGMAIGSATQQIQPGEYVHTHNLKSNYLPTYTLRRE